MFGQLLINTVLITNHLQLCINSTSWCNKKEYTVTSWLFMHIVSTEKMCKDLRDRKDMRGTKYAYY